MAIYAFVDLRIFPFVKFYCVCAFSSRASADTGVCTGKKTVAASSPAGAGWRPRAGPVPVRGVPAGP
eukprot:scaffold31788_cov36-Prasinocladus_malaysianus.AAC.1